MGPWISPRLSLHKYVALLKMRIYAIYMVVYIEDITRWLEDMNFMFEWQEQYLTSERSERVSEANE